MSSVFSNISLLIAYWPRVSHMRSISLVNDSQLHDQSHFGDPAGGSGLHGRQHALVLPAHSPILPASTHAASRKPNLWINPGFTSWNVAVSSGECERSCLAFEEIIKN